MPFRRLTKAQAAVIKRQLVEAGPDGQLVHSQSSLARRYGVSQVAIHKIAHDLTHRDVPWPGAR